MSKQSQSSDQIESVEDREAVVKALARTYGGDRDPWERVQEYQRVLEYTGKHPNKGSTAVANALDLPRSRIRSWVDSDGRPDPVRGIQVAESHDWLPLSLDGDVMTGLNVLVAWIFSGGSIDVERYVPLFSIRTDADRERLTAAFERVGVQSELIREDVEKRATEMRPTPDGVILGRLLHVLGAPIGAKNEAADLSLPAYLDKAPHHDRLDFARTYVLNRQTAREDRPKTPVQVTEARSAAYRQELIDFFSDVVGDTGEIRGGNEGNQFFLTRRAASVLCEEPTFGEWV